MEKPFAETLDLEFENRGSLNQFAQQPRNSQRAQILSRNTEMSKKCVETFHSGETELSPLQCSQSTNDHVDRDATHHAHAGFPRRSKGKMAYILSVLQRILLLREKTDSSLAVPAVPTSDQIASILSMAAAQSQRNGSSAACESRDLLPFRYLKRCETCLLSGDSCLGFAYFCQSRTTK